MPDPRRAPVGPGRSGDDGDDVEATLTVAAAKQAATKQAATKKAATKKTDKSSGMPMDMPMGMMDRYR